MLQLYGEAYGETYKHCSVCGCSVASVYQGNVHTSSGTDETATRFPHSTQLEGVHIPFSKDRLLAESEACLLTRKTGKNGSQT